MEQPQPSQHNGEPPRLMMEKKEALPIEELKHFFTDKFEELKARLELVESKVAALSHEHDDGSGKNSMNPLEKEVAFGSTDWKYRVFALLFLFVVRHTDNRKSKFPKESLYKVVTSIPYTDQFAKDFLKSTFCRAITYEQLLQSTIDTYRLTEHHVSPVIRKESHTSLLGQSAYRGVEFADEASIREQAPIYFQALKVMDCLAPNLDVHRFADCAIDAIRKAKDELALLMGQLAVNIKARGNRKRKLDHELLLQLENDKAHQQNQPPHLHHPHHQQGHPLAHHHQHQHAQPTHPHPTHQLQQSHLEDELGENRQKRQKMITSLIPPSPNDFGQAVRPMQKKK